MEHSKQLGEAKIGKLILKFSIPAIIGMLVNALYNVVDRIFVGQGVGSAGLAAISIGFPVMLIIMAFGMLIGLGSTALISIRLGEKNKDEAELIMGNAIVLLLVVSLTLTVIGLIFLEPLLQLFGASPEILQLAKTYMSIILLGAAFQNIGFGVNNFIRAEGNPKTAMLTMLIGAVTNIILDPIFIFGFKWGIAGAALATVLSMMVSAAWVILYYRGDRSTLKIRAANLILRAWVIRQIVALGSAPFVMQVAASGIMALINHSLVTYGGDLAVSAMGIVHSVMMLILMPVFGINQGVQPIIGYNYGARQFDRVKHALKLAIFAATAVTTLGFIFIQGFAEQIVQVFSRTDRELIALGAKALSTFMLCLPIIGFQVVSANYFQAVGKPRQAMFLSLSRQVLLLIPALLILPRFFGLNGVFYAGPTADLLSSMLTGTWLIYEMKHLDARHLEEQNWGPELPEPDKI